VLIGMMSVFTLVAAFVGGMNVAMDTVAGERERRSLLPLLMNPVRRREIVLGKWLAVGLFSFAGLILNLAGFAIVFASAGMHPSAGVPRLLLAVTAGILPLALLAASLQLLISTVCRAAKEARTYLSMLVFLPMGLGMFQVFFRRRRAGGSPSCQSWAASATRTLDEGWACPIRSGGRAGLLHRRTRPAGIGGCRKQTAP
jgi:ABC-type Na+ efflux pump permease subunit